MWSRTPQSTLPEQGHFIYYHRIRWEIIHNIKMYTALSVELMLILGWSVLSSMILNHIYSMPIFCFVHVWESITHKRLLRKPYCRVMLFHPQALYCMAYCICEWEFLHYFQFTMKLHIKCSSMWEWYCSEMRDLTDYLHSALTLLSVQLQPPWHLMFFLFFFFLSSHNTRTCIH